MTLYNLDFKGNITYHQRNWEYGLITIDSGVSFALSSSRWVLDYASSHFNSLLVSKNCPSVVIQDCYFEVTGSDTGVLVSPILADLNKPDVLDFNNSTFVGFKSLVDGGVAKLDGFGSVFIQNSRFAHNEANEGASFFLSSSLKVYVLNSVFENNTASFSGAALFATQ